MEISHGLCRLKLIPSCADSVNKNINYELLLLNKLYLVWLILCDIIHALGKYALNAFMICSSYDIMITVIDMFMTYAFPLSSK